LRALGIQALSGFPEMVNLAPGQQAQISVVSAEELAQSEKEQIVRLCSEAFDEDFGEMFWLLPGSTHMLARIEGELASHACWVTRWLQPGDLRPLRTAYIEAVATNPSRQGEGLGSFVMRRITEEIGGYEMGALSPAHVPFYERLGWEMWHGPTAIRTQGGLLPTPGEEVMVLRTRLTPALDTSTLITAEWREGELW
jgi:aminoglycoside 2'-N-acetyltransferase I